MRADKTQKVVVGKVLNSGLIGSSRSCSRFHQTKRVLLFACWIIFHASANFFQINFFKKLFQEHYQTFKQFGSKSGPDLGPSCLQMLSADNKSLD